MDSLFSRLNETARVLLPLLVTAVSTVVFAVNFESLMSKSHLGRLIAVMVAAALVLSAGRAMYTQGGRRPVVFTVCFLFVMGGAAVIGACFCRDQSLRLQLAAIALLLVIAGAIYAMRNLRRPMQGGALL
ncbi:MAG: hypothetical protein QOH88_3509 [Verrucomicrobiota bacterium]|jgi:uncharacterized membrane protein YhhN